MNGDESGPARVAHAAMRGTVGAMAMTGIRRVLRDVGLLQEEPPRALVGQAARRALRAAPRRRRSLVVEVIHWGIGAAGGAAYALLPRGLRRRRWSGPVWGLAIWVSFDALAAPALGVEHAGRRHVRQRVALIADHLLYGFVLSEMRPRPQEDEEASP